MVVAGLLFSRYAIGGNLGRDEAIYAYGGQQLTHGVAPYASIFDPKAPMATFVAGLGAGVARLLGGNDLDGIRIVFFLSACLTALAVYLLAKRLWQSTTAGLAAAVVFASFQAFAADALAGPDAKTPGVLFAVVSMWLCVRRQWPWAAAAGTLAFLTWQPFGIYFVVALVLAPLTAESGRRLRSLGSTAVGVAVPLAVVSLYFAVAGAFGKFIEAAVVFPVVGVHRAPESVPARIDRILHIISADYHVSGLLLEIGLVLLLALAVVHVVLHRNDIRRALLHPLVSVVLVTGLLQIAYAFTDFQGGPDVFPFLPYGALGLGGTVALVLTRVRARLPRQLVAGTVVASLVTLTALSWTWFTDAAALDKEPLRMQRTEACAIAWMLGPQGGLYAIGDPTPLVLLRRRNPDRFIYLGSGVLDWKLDHVQDRFAGWVAQIIAAHPQVIVMSTFASRPMSHALVRAGYNVGYDGKWRVFVTPQALDRGMAHGVTLTPEATPYAANFYGVMLPASGCSQSQRADEKGRVA